MEGDWNLIEANRPDWRFAGIVLCVYAILLAIVVAFHEPYSDEADAWLAARDLSVPQLIQFTRHVGNPASWYLILMPLAKLDAPYASMLWAHFAIAVLAAGAFLAFAPFPRITRVLFVFSYYSAYQYAALARPYSLTALALFLTAACYRTRCEQPIRFSLCVFLLFNTTAHGAFFAGVITFIFAIQHARRAIPAVLIMIAGGAVVAAQLWPPTDAQISGMFTLRYPQFILDTLTRAAVVPIGPTMLDPLWLALNIIVFFAVTIWLMSRPTVLTMFFAGLAALFYIFAFKWCVPSRHAGLILLWLIFVLWISRYETPSLFTSSPRAMFVNWRWLMRVLNVALIMACIKTAIAWNDEIRIEYSHGAQMAHAIREHNWDNAPIAGSYIAESILPYLHTKQLWNLSSGQFLSHNKWDSTYYNNANLDAAMMWERIHRAQAIDPRMQLIWNWSLPDPEGQGYRLLFKTAGRVGESEEVFYFYAPLDLSRE